MMNELGMRFNDHDADTHTHTIHCFPTTPCRSTPRSYMVHFKPKVIYRQTAANGKFLHSYSYIHIPPTCTETANRDDVLSTHGDPHLNIMAVLTLFLRRTPIVCISSRAVCEVVQIKLPMHTRYGRRRRTHHLVRMTDLFGLESLMKRFTEL